MFNIGPLELLVLAGVALIVIGPDRLPDFAREAANMLKTFREIASGARQQLKDELGPEFAELDLRNLNPRTAVQRAVFGDDVDLGRLNPRNALRDAIFGDEDVRAADPRAVLRGMDDEQRAEPMSIADVPPVVEMSKPGSRTEPGRARPRPRPTQPVSGYDDDVT